MSLQGLVSQSLVRSPGPSNRGATSTPSHAVSSTGGKAAATVAPLKQKAAHAQPPQAAAVTKQVAAPHAQQVRLACYEVASFFMILMQGPLQDANGICMIWSRSLHVLIHSSFLSQQTWAGCCKPDTKACISYRFIMQCRLPGNQLYICRLHHLSASSTSSHRNQQNRTCSMMNEMDRGKNPCQSQHICNHNLSFYLQSIRSKQEVVPKVQKLQQLQMPLRQDQG